MFVVSYNVHGLKHPIKRKLKKLECAIALIQETHLSENEHKKLKREWVNQVFHASYGKKRAVAILISKSLPFSAEKVIKDNMGRYIMVVGIVGDMTISILNIYAPNEENETSFKNIANIVTSKGRGMIIMGGDFNTIQNGKFDRLPSERGPNTKKSKVLNNVSTLNKNWVLLILGEIIIPKERTLLSILTHTVAIREYIFFCVSKQQVNKITNGSIEPITISDHAPVILSLELGRESLFKYWRLNVSVLSDEKVVQELKKSLKEYFQINDNGEVSPAILWEAGKAVIRGKIIEITSRLKKA